MELLQKVLLDVEVALNNRPLDYVEDDIQLPILTPSSLLHIQPNALPELESNHIQDYDFRECSKYLSKCRHSVVPLDQRILEGAPWETPPKAQG